MSTGSTPHRASLKCGSSQVLCFAASNNYLFCLTSDRIVQFDSSLTNKRVTDELAHYIVVDSEGILYSANAREVIRHSAISNGACTDIDVHTKIGYQTIDYIVDLILWMGTVVSVGEKSVLQWKGRTTKWLINFLLKNLSSCS